MLFQEYHKKLKRTGSFSCFNKILLTNITVILMINLSAVPANAIIPYQILLSTINAIVETGKPDKNSGNDQTKLKKGVINNQQNQNTNTGANSVKPKIVIVNQQNQNTNTGTNTVKPKIVIVNQQNLNTNTSKLKKDTALTGNALNKISTDDKRSSDDDFDELEMGSSGLGFQFIFSGFIELENIISTYTKQEPGDINKKNEIRTKLSMQIGNENFYMKAVPNFYVLPLYASGDRYSDYRYSDKIFEISRNGRISGKYSEASLNECYLNLSFNHLRIRIGNQIYGWGTSDVFNPTSFINPTDSRELFYKDSDETTIGVPSVSTMIFASDFTLECVYVPVQTGAISPIAQNFWAYRYDLGFMTIVEQEHKDLPATTENSGYGARLAGCINGVDLSLSVYQGPDASPILRPMAYITDTSDIMVLQEYHPSTNFGTDFSFKLWKFELHGEAAYSPNKYGVVDETPKNFSIKNAEAVLSEPFSTRTSKMYSYSTGFNFIYEKLTITSEWIQSAYADKSLMLPFNTDLLASSINYSFFDSRLRMSLGGLYDFKHEGYVLMPAMYININDVSVKILYSHMSDSPSDDITMFSVFKKHDIVIVGIRYEF